MSHSFSSRPTVIFQPSHATIQAVVTACAMVACADGNVANKERRSFLRFLHHHGVLERYGRAPYIAAFNKAVRDASLLTLDEICTPLISSAPSPERTAHRWWRMPRRMSPWPTASPGRRRSRCWR